MNNEEPMQQSNFKSPNTSGGAISIIDLVVMLIRRKLIIAIVFLLFIALGTTVTSLNKQTKTYTYSITVEIGSQIIDGSIKPIETTENFLATFKHRYIPQAINEYAKTHPNNTPQIEAIALGGNFLQLKTVGTEENSASIVKLLQSITTEAIQGHSNSLLAIKNSLSARLQIEKNTSNFSHTDKAKLIASRNLIQSISLQLATLHDSREILPPTKRLNPPSGGNNKIIITASAFTGLFLGIFAAFFAEFVSKVRKQMNKQ